MTRLETRVKAPGHPEHCTCCTCRILTPRLSDAEVRTAATLFKALADPARLHILDVLSQQTQHICVCDLEGIVGFPNERTGQRPRQATISHHLKVLRDAGLVGYQKRGLRVYYYVHGEQLQAARNLLETLCRPLTPSPLAHIQ